MRAVLMGLAVVAATMVVGPAASAGPPAHLCRHLTSNQCEEALGPYTAFQFVKQYLSKPVYGGDCERTRHPKSRFYRCTVRVESAQSPTPCIVEALLYEHRRAHFDVKWRQQSAACKT
jgi:hypothetical protein